LKFIFCWVAFFTFSTVVFPLGINRFLTDNTTKKHDETESKTNVYFTKSDKVLKMDTEDYILGVLMAEMPAEFELEALKAQCVAARTYLYNKTFLNEEYPGHRGATVCTDSAHCQSFVTKEDAMKKWGKNASLYLEKCKKAVEETKGVIAQYDNKPINAVFHAYASGKTENASDVWGGSVSYLKSVESPGDISAPEFLSSKTVLESEFMTLMQNEYGCDFQNEFIGDVIRTEGGSVDKILIGNQYIRGVDIRKTFGLKSACFDVVKEGDKVIFNVKGYGHGVGLSQYGANYYAKQGMKYDEILKKYYTGISIVKV